MEAETRGEARRGEEEKKVGEKRVSKLTHVQSRTGWGRAVVLGIFWAKGAGFDEVVAGELHSTLPRAACRGARRGTPLMRQGRRICRSVRHGQQLALRQEGKQHVVQNLTI